MESQNTVVTNRLDAISYLGDAPLTSKLLAKVDAGSAESS